MPLSSAKSKFTVIQHSNNKSIVINDKSLSRVINPEVNISARSVVTQCPQTCSFRHCTRFPFINKMRPWPILSLSPRMHCGSFIAQNEFWLDLAHQKCKEKCRFICFCILRTSAKVIAGVNGTNCITNVHRSLHWFWKAISMITLIIRETLFLSGSRRGARQ